ncbi:MAG: ATP-binding protein [Kineosporiaceae bacterium]|nr:ATP-binding protein [Kineosporiaceae bacterium]
MPPVVLTFAPAAEHVRMARLVVVAAARRAGVDEVRLDDVRLAVGEMCARAVNRCAKQATASVAPVAPVMPVVPVGAGAAPAVDPPEVVWRIRVEVLDDGPDVQVCVCDPAGSVELPEDAVTFAMAATLSDSLRLVPEVDGGLSGVELGWHRAG